MNADSVLDIVERVLLSRQLSPIERVILHQSWLGKSYGEMAQNAGYGSNYFKEVGSQLWHDLSEAIGQRVTKKNLHLVLAQYQLSEEEPKEETQQCFSTSEQQQAKFLSKVERVPSVSRTHIRQDLEIFWQQKGKEFFLLSAIVCEVDYFKWYNDTHGYMSGDVALYQIANALSQCVQQEQSSLMRYGGTKFAATLPYINGHEVANIGESMRESIKTLGIPYDLPGIDGLPSDFLSISVGVASVTPSSDNSPDVLLNAAEEALSQAKRQGRNRVFVHPIFDGKVLLTEPILHFPKLK